MVADSQPITQPPKTNIIVRLAALLVSADVAAKMMAQTIAQPMLYAV
jgi:hypothetical protein